ncbi:hypothetical protein [Streptomyces atratus]|uniref:hypothetical protein n=1 Tax=Streptomyces atratus TaxID=1893 RepID=UPI0036670FC0
MASPQHDSLDQAAQRLLGRLITGHLTGVRSDSTDASLPGRFLDGSYDMASGTAPAHELVWGNYFLLSCLTRLTTP